MSCLRFCRRRKIRCVFSLISRSVLKALPSWSLLTTKISLAWSRRRTRWCHLTSESALLRPRWNVYSSCRGRCNRNSGICSVATQVVLICCYYWLQSRTIQAVSIDVTEFHSSLPACFLVVSFSNVVFASLSKKQATSTELILVQWSTWPNLVTQNWYWSSGPHDLTSSHICWGVDKEVSLPRTILTRRWHWYSFVHSAELAKHCHSTSMTI